MKFLVTSDLHLTDARVDQYRFGIFPQLKKWGKKFNVENLFVLGDITDFKDRHSSILTNRIVDEMLELTTVFSRIVILRGNHDCTDPNNPFFRFLDAYPSIMFISEPETHVWDGDSFLCLPHSRDVQKDWKGLIKPKYTYVLLHETFDGSVGSNGYKLDGISPKLFDGVGGLCISGDIHVPQKIGPIHYVGSPYPIRFGDSFDARVLLVNDTKLTDLHYKTIKKVTLRITNPDTLYRKSLTRDDQVKIYLRLTKSRFVEWPTLRKEIIDICTELELELKGVFLEEIKKPSLDVDDDVTVQSVQDPKDIMKSYAKGVRIDDYHIKIGEELINET